ncbi:MAG: hypothetical protein ACO1SX_10830 [Actinomycetota bacterium]
MTWKLILPFVAVLGSSAAETDPFGASRWGAKPVAIERLQKRAAFPVLIPTRLPSRFDL